jgi:hypothetical protein
MWVAPGKMLNRVFGNDLSYVFQGAQMNVANELYSSQFSLDSNGLTTYFTYLLWRTTPIAWLGVLSACIGLFTKDNPTFKPFMKRTIVYFGLLALIFILIFGIAKGRNSSHYILMSFVCLDVIAGIGLVGALRWLGNNVRPFKRVWIMSALIISLIGFQIASAISQFPYFYTYVNPLAELFTKNNPNSGYGEGLEMAGEYLSQKPNARELTAISFFGYGPFSYFFSGNTIHLPPTNIIEPSLLEKIHQADYLVIYDIHLKKQVRLLLLMDSLKGISPEKIIKINNLDYVSIYRVIDLPESLFKSLNK